MNKGRKEPIEALLLKYLRGNLTPPERHEFFDMLSDAENEQFFKDILLMHISDFKEAPDNRPVDFDNIFDNILSEINEIDHREYVRKEDNRRITIKQFTRYAGIIAAVSIIAFFLGRLTGGTQKSAPASLLALISYNEISAPYGSKSEIKLPDGTTVVLNAGSTLRYQSDYNESNRDLELTGEAYFKVARNADIPLVVNAGSINVKAIGTEFNIKAYDEEGTVETTLIEGKVEITRHGKDGNKDQFVGLEPNQKAIFIKDESSFVLEKIKNSSFAIEPVKTISENILISPKVNVSQVVAWTEGKLILRAENLGNLSIDLERKYDVKFVFTDEEIKKYRFTGVLLDETLEQVLDAIKLTAPINYVLDGKTVHLSSDTRQLNDFSKHMNQEK